MKIIFLIFLCFLSLNSQSEENPTFRSIDVGRAEYGIDVYRLGLKKEFTNWLKRKGLDLSGYLEASINYWHESKSQIYGVAFSPVIFIPLCRSCKSYFEVGTGVSYISQKTIGKINMSSLFQFEDRIGFGVKIENIDYHLRHMHYSNAGLVQPNDGIDILIAGVTFKF